MRSDCVLKELHRILGAHFSHYQDHLNVSGCGVLEREGDYVVADLSQLHVGGYESLIYIDSANGRIFLFWLKGSVQSGDWQLYGDRPVPTEVLASVEKHMNEAWGHVATFKFFGELLRISKKKPNQSPEPTVMSVTPRADARVAPATTVAHL